jgi:hypothetical protein
MTAVHPTAFKQQVAKEKKEKLAKQKSTRYATLAGGLNFKLQKRSEPSLVGRIFKTNQIFQRVIQLAGSRYTQDINNAAKFSLRN